MNITAQLPNFITYPDKKMQSHALSLAFVVSMKYKILQDLCTLHCMRAYNIVCSTAAVLVMAKVIQELDSKAPASNACIYVRFKSCPTLA
jgi:dissimilatory sulfite reductase (desulfoviridin) alpha/beta subunit